MKLVYYDYPEIKQKILAEGKYSLENEINAGYL